MEGRHERDAVVVVPAPAESGDGLLRPEQRLHRELAERDDDLGLDELELADEELVEDLHLEDIEIVVWTVNEEADIKRMLDLGIDGIISDYPDRVVKVADDL